MPTGQSALSVSRHKFHQPSLALACLSFCGVLPPSLLSSLVVPCWFLGYCLEEGGDKEQDQGPRTKDIGQRTSTKTKTNPNPNPNTRHIQDKDKTIHVALNSGAQHSGA